MKRTSVVLTYRQVELIRAIADTQGLLFAETLRRVLDMGLEAMIASLVVLDRPPSEDPSHEHP